jgi:ABC-2 type transport system permease protein
MRWRELARRNFIVMWRDWLALGVNVALPAAMLVILQALEGVDSFFSPTSLVPGICLFGFAMLTMVSAMALAQDRESSMFERLLTTPVGANEFVAGYSVPYLGIASLQTVMVFLIALPFGITIRGSVLVVVLFLFLMAIWYVAIGMILGSALPYVAVSGVWSIVLILTIFGGTWVNLPEIGGVFVTVADLLPFAHAMEAMRGVMIQGAGFGDVTGDLTWVLAYVAVTVVVAVVLFRRRMTA